MTDAALAWYLMLGLSVAAILAGLQWLVVIRRWLRRSQRAIGTVRSVAEADSRDTTLTGLPVGRSGRFRTRTPGDSRSARIRIPGSRKSWVATIDYTDHAGRAHSAETHVSSPRYAFKPGRQLPIRYAPEQPEMVVIDRFWDIHAMPAVLIHGGLLLAILVWLGRGVLSGEAPSLGTDLSSADPLAERAAICGAGGLTRPSACPAVRIL